MKLIALFVFSSAACSATPAAQSIDAAGNPHPATDAGGPIDPGPPDAPTCGGEQLPLARGLPPDILILLDRSGSMADAPMNGGAASKWDACATSIKSVVMATQDQIHWGLGLFPTDTFCAVDNIAVPVETQAYSAIAQAIDATGPNGTTPTWKAIEAADATLGALTDQNPKYILLATDGIPNCTAESNCACPPGWFDNGANQCQLTGGGIYDYYTCDFVGGNSINKTYQTIAQLAARGVHTFVVGLPADGGDNLGMNLLAQAGGEARPGAIKYYMASSQSDFQNAITSIASGLASCTFPLNPLPPDPNMVNIYVGGQPAPRDPTHMDGWDYTPDGGSVRLYGSWCQRVQSGATTDVHAVFGCPPVGIHR